MTEKMLIFIGVTVYLALGYFLARNHYKKGYYNLWQSVMVFFLYPVYYAVAFLLLILLAIISVVYIVSVMIVSVLDKIKNM